MQDDEHPRKFQISESTPAADGACVCFIRGRPPRCDTSQSAHRWPKRNMGHLWRNMRVCMGKIEFET